MSLPFYESGKTVKNPVTEIDVKLIMGLLQKIKPHQIFATGDFSYPHGTHIVCFRIILEAMNRLRETEEWTKNCWLWMYRGAGRNLKPIRLK
jgi:glucosamine-6-phosphate deaminase